MTFLIFNSRVSQVNALSFGAKLPIAKLRSSANIEILWRMRLP